MENGEWRRDLDRDDACKWSALDNPDGDTLILWRDAHPVRQKTFSFGVASAGPITADRRLCCAGGQIT